MPTSLSLIEDEVTGDLKAITISDANNNRVRKLDMKTILIHIIAEDGNGADGGTVIDAKLDYDKSTGDIVSFVSIWMW